MPPPDDSKSAPVALLLVAAGVLLHVFPSVAIGGDGEVRFDSLSRLLRDGTLDSSKYSLAGPLAATPLWLLGEAVGNTKRVTWAFNHVVTLAGVAALAWLFRNRLPRAELTAFVLLLLFGSMLPWNAMTFGGDTFTAVALAVGLALLATSRAQVTGAVLCVWGTANTPASAVGLGLACAVLCWHSRRLRYLLVPAAAAAAILAENWLRRGDPFANGYTGEAGYPNPLPYAGQPGFSYPLFFGLLSVFLSFDKGLVYFAPGLFALYPRPASQRPATEEGSSSSVAGLCEAGAIEREEREADVRLVHRVWVAAVVGLVLVYARWWAWYGGAVWGPRFFLLASFPAALVLARWTARAATNPPWANALVLFALALSCWVGANGAVFRDEGHRRFWADNFALEHLTWYVPELSVLWQPFAERFALDRSDWLRLAAFAACFAYLAWPVVRALAPHARSACVAAWRAVRSGPRWRF